MAKLLFSLESTEDLPELDSLDLDHETSIVTDNQCELNRDILDIAETSDELIKADVAYETLCEVKELMTYSESAGGLTVVASEAVRIATESICANIGVNPSRVGLTSLYAIENFQSSSSRRNSTLIATEGLGDFLKGLWEKIKGAFKTLWNKITEFWDKHISTLGRVKKSLVSIKAKISKNTGTVNGEGHLEKVPNSLINAFVGSGDINAAKVESFIDRHSKVMDTLRDSLNTVMKHQEELVKKTMTSLESKAKSDSEKDSKEDQKNKVSEEGLSDMIKQTTRSLLGKNKNVPVVKEEPKEEPKEEAKEESTKSEVKTNDEPLKAPDESIEFGSKENPLLGGVYFKYEFKVDMEDGTVDTNILKDDTDDSNPEATLDIASKEQLSKLIDKAIGVIDSTIKSKDTIRVYNSGLDKLMNTISTNLDKLHEEGDSKEIQTPTKNAMTGLRNLSNSILTFSTKVVGLNVDVAKAVLYYTGTCLKQYK